MFKRLRSLLAAPVFDDEEKTRATSLLYTVLALAFLITLAAGVASFLLTHRPPQVLIPVFLAFFELGAYLLMRRGSVRAASVLIVSLSWLLFSAPSFLQGGLNSPAALLPVIAVVIAGLLLGDRGTASFFFLTIAYYSFLAYAQVSNLLPQALQPVLPVFQWVLSVTTLALTTLLLRLTLRSYRKSLQDAQNSASRLRQMIQELEVVQSRLEENAQQRSSELEKQVARLQAAAEISQQIAARRDLDALLQEVADQICRQFGIYHTGIYLLDQQAEYVELRASSSPGGKELLEQNQRIKIDERSTIGFVASSRKPYAVKDIESDPLFIKNPYLPETHMELALPMIAKAALLGVIDLQGSQGTAFDESDLTLLQLIAGQVATAIENARLLGETRQALESTRRAYSESSRQAWQDKLRARPVGFRKDRQGLEQVESSTQAETGQGAPSGSSTTLPIRVRGNQIGILNAQKPGADGEWTEEELSLLSSLVEQLEVALESARLFQETQRRAERERLAGRITAHMRASTDPQSILQTAVQELRQALQAKRAQVILQPVPGATSSSSKGGGEEG